MEKTKKKKNKKMMEPRKKYVMPLIGALLLMGCAEELPQEQRGAGGRCIGFSASVNNGWDQSGRTRGAAEQAVPVAMSGGRLVLFLQAEVSDGLTTLKNTKYVAEKKPALAYPKQANADRRYAHAEDMQAATRGMMRTTSDLYDAIGVLAYSFSGTWDGTQTPDFMYNLKAAKGSGIYATTSGWPDADTNVRFYSYAPHSEDADGITLSAASVAGSPQLSYEVPTDVTKQSDLLATLCDETATQAHTSPQPLEFHHLLTAVCFKIGDNMAAGTINKITLKNIKYHGTYSFPSATPWTTDNGAWEVDAEVKDFVYTPSPAFTTDGTANVQINTGENVFMMLPQTFDADAALEVEFTPNGESNSETYSANIRGLATWSQGKTVTYTISIDPNASKYILTVVPTDATAILNMSYWGDSETVNISSYKETEGVQEAVKWNITGYSLDGGNSWIASTKDDTATFSPATGDGGTSANSVTVTLNYAPNVIGTPANTTLTNATAVANYDLSLHDVVGNVTTRNTANCYIVRAPGTYKLSCVYGNAIKNGATNQNAYKSTVTQADLEYVETAKNESRKWYQKSTLLNFVNAYGEAITDPWIDQNQHSGSNIQLATAELVWQDTPNLVQNVGLTTEEGHSFVTFTVTKDHIAAGNALIQVKSSDGIVQWSWHIWLSPLSLNQFLSSPGFTGATTSLTYSFPYVESPFATGNTDGNQCYTFKRTNTSAGYTLETIDNGVMLVPLGLIHEPVGLTFSTQDLLVKVVQEESGKVAVFQVKQPGGSDTDFYVRSTHYQWGRKDPFPTKDELEGYTFQIATTKAEKPKLYESIQHPNTLYAYTNTTGPDDGWWNGNALDIEATESLATSGSGGKDLNKIANLWDAQLDPRKAYDNNWYNYFNQDHSVKSIYDPCPPGFKVPETYALQAFQAEDINDIISGYGPICDLSNDKRVILIATGTRGGNWESSYPYNGHFVNIELTTIYWGIYWTSQAFMQQGTGAVSLYFHTYRSSPWFRPTVTKGDNPSYRNVNDVPEGCAIFLCKDD